MLAAGVVSIPVDAAHMQGLAQRPLLFCPQQNPCHHKYGMYALRELG